MCFPPPFLSSLPCLWETWENACGNQVTFFFAPLPSSKFQSLKLSIYSLNYRFWSLQTWCSIYCFGPFGFFWFSWLIPASLLGDLTVFAHIGPTCRTGVKNPLLLQMLLNFQFPSSLKIGQAGLGWWESGAQQLEGHKCPTTAPGMGISKHRFLFSNIFPAFWTLQQ